MPRPATGARERFTTATLELLREGGLSAAGLNEVVARAQAPKGSLYHYFPGGKTQLVRESLEIYRDSVATYIGQALSGRGGLRRRLERLFEVVAQRMAEHGFARSCAVGAVILDLAPGDDKLRQCCQAALAHWAEVAAGQLVELPPARRAAAGRLLVTLLEGAQLSARALQNDRPLRDAAAAMAAWTTHAEAER